MIMLMSKIVRTIADLFFPFVIVFGLYIVFHGHLTPGGGFQGGAVMASGFAMYAISRRIEHKALSKNIFSIIESLSLLMFAGFAAAGLMRSFFYNFLANSGLLFGETVLFGSNAGVLNTGGVIPFMNIAVAMEVASAFAIVVSCFILISIYKVDK